MNPIWITVDGGDTFEGHQGHWADCFFSNATRDNIERALSGENALFGSGVYDIREMTDDEVAKYPEAVEFRESLVAEYGHD